MLILTRLSFLQQIQKAATHGYVLYQLGKVVAEKLPGLVKKFEKYYEINQTRQQCYRKKLQGKASAKLYIYAHPDDKQSFFWVLMLTDGAHLAKELEKLKDLRIKSTRLQYGDYQLIQKPSQIGKPSFTWSLTSDAMHFYTSEIRRLIRSRNLGEIRIFQKHLAVMAGFSGVRSQKKVLQKIFTTEAKRHFAVVADDKIPNQYTRQRKTETVIYLEAFIKKMIAADLTVMQQLKTHRENLKKRSVCTKKSN